MIVPLVRTCWGSGLRGDDQDLLKLFALFDGLSHVHALHHNGQKSSVMDANVVVAVGLLQSCGCFDLPAVVSVIAEFDVRYRNHPMEKHGVAKSHVEVVFGLHDAGANISPQDFGGYI